MRKYIYTILILLLGSLFNAAPGFGQCDQDLLLKDCAPNLGTYNYLKSFTFSFGQKKKTPSEYSYIFSKGSTYMLIVCEDNATKGKMELELFDNEDNLVASTFEVETGKNYSYMMFPCSATGVYRLKASLRDARKGCGICILGFSKD